MRTLLNIADDIPGLVKAALLFNAKTVSKGSVSALWLKDGDKEAMVDLADGLADDAFVIRWRFNGCQSGFCPNFR